MYLLLLLCLYPGVNKELNWILNVFGMWVFHVVFLYSSVGYLYLSGSGLITSVGEEIANLSAIVY